MQHLEVSCAVRRFFKSLGFKGLMTPLNGLHLDCLAAMSAHPVWNKSIPASCLSVHCSFWYRIFKEAVAMGFFDPQMLIAYNKHVVLYASEIMVM